MADTLSRMPTESADTTPTEVDIAIAVIDMSSNTEDETTLQIACCQADAHVAEDNDDVLEEVGIEPTIKEFLGKQATDSSSQ